ncbi:MAG: Uma2 family endonuclease [Chroococcus sp. CMT-3BRIN-NPC107]|jgi:Uma2 family endonuclease|nr:Uma2 family endonuclease [Chroococcus sp. CMT-3BRIN-NPC107]
MVSTASTQKIINSWVSRSWEEFINLADNPEYEGGKFYYEQKYLKIEMPPIGSSHSQDNHLIANIISLYATVKNIRIKGLTNCSFRQPNIREFQPDLAFYIGDEFNFPPRNNSPINLLEFSPPNLVIEFGATSINDDLGHKRLIYDRVGIQEYWVVDVNNNDIIAFSISEGRSGEVKESLVLPGLAISLVESALKRSQTEDDGAINRWLLQTFS